MALHYGYVCVVALAVANSNDEYEHSTRALRVGRAVEQTEYQTVRDTKEPATLALAELRDRQLAWLTRLEQVSVDFTFNRMPRADAVSEVSFRVRYAEAGAKRFVSYTRKGDTTPRFIKSYDGLLMKKHEPFQMIGHVTPEMTTSVDRHGVLYFALAGVPLTEDVRRTEIYPPTAFAAPSFYRVLETLQEVDGHLCHVVTSEWDTMWVDHLHGCALRRRIWLRKTNAADPGMLSNLICSADFTQEDGIWFPRQVTNVRYGAQESPPDMQGRVRFVDRVDVHEIRANRSVSSEDFELTFPPGTMIKDYILGKSYFVPEGTHMLDEAIAIGTPLIDGKPAGVPGRIPPLARLSGQLLLCFVSATVVAFGAASCILHVRRRHYGR